MAKQNMLLNGSTAPDFAVRDVFGQPVALSDYKGKKLLLCFFRYAGCPWCNLAIHRLTLQASQLETLGLHVVAFIQSESENIQRYIYGRHTPQPPFPIIADPQRKVYDAYGIINSLKPLKRSIVHIPDWLRATIGHGFHQGKFDGDASLVPAHFLIGPHDYIIHKASYDNDYFQDWPMIEILDFAQFGPSH